ncbi:hypothetical protein WG66_009552 [Moniliophthora roreri]|nr:hypothetical protein WG66_009552 [Moniliophthora roreri]
MSCSLSAISFASGLPDRRGGVRLQKSGLFFYDHENIPVVNMVDGISPPMLLLDNPANRCLEPRRSNLMAPGCSRTLSTTFRKYRRTSYLDC